MIEVVGIVGGLYCDNQKLFSVGDKIIRYDGISVTERDCLLSLIRKSEKKIFGRIYVDVIRNGESISFEVRKGKLGLKLKESLISDQNLVDKELLNKANETIRLANERINELKFNLSEMRKRVDYLQKENEELFSKSSSVDDTISHIEILGFTDRPEMLILKKRYKTLSAIYHPDKGGNKLMMQRINEAYQCLKNKK